MNKIKQNYKGVALVLVLFVMVILLVVVLTLSSLALTDNQISQRHFYAKKTFNLARSGLIRARSELRGNSEWGKNPVTHSYGANGEDGSYTVSVNIETIEDRSYWKVTSTGILGDYRRTIVSWVEPESFSKYMYLTDSEIGVIGGQQLTIWFFDSDIMDGPVHTNGYFSISRNPKFADRVTSSNSGDSFYNSANRTYRQGGSTITDPSLFYRYQTNYNIDKPIAHDESPDFSFTGGVPAAEFPSNLNDVKTKAQYIFNDDISFIRFSSTGSVQVKPVRSAMVTLPTNELTIYVNGNIQDISGTVNGKVTVASEKEITIKDNITYNNDDIDMLGIVALKDIVVDTNINVNRDLTIKASLMSIEGSFYVKNYDAGRPRGYLNIFGSLVQNRRGPVGTFTAAAGIRSGYSKNYSYDKRLKFLRPPNFPHTGRYAIKSFRDKGALGGS